MLYGVYLSAAGMARSQQEQDVIANNLANVDTVGFKRDLSVFRQRLQEAQGAEGQLVPANLRQATGGAFVDSVRTDFTQGSLDITNRNLDVAINGEGFLTVQDGQNVRVTRDGRLALVGGKLVRQIDGKSVLNNEGKEILLPDASAADIRIDDEGNVWDNKKLAGQLGVVTFDQPENLMKVGGNLYEPGGQETHPASGSIVSEALETSTVDPSMEMVQMLKTSRAFQLNAEMITLQNQSLSRLVNDLPKL